MFIFVPNLTRSPMSIPVTQFTTNFYLTPNPPQLRLTDTTDWSVLAGGEVAYNIGVNFSIQDPSSNIFYQNTYYGTGGATPLTSPDIHIETSVVNPPVLVFPTNLPTTIDASGNTVVDNGNYIITAIYTVQTIAGGAIATYTATNTVNYCLPTPNLAIQSFVDCVNLRMVVTDASTFPVGTSITRLFTITNPVGATITTAAASWASSNLYSTPNGMVYNILLAITAIIPLTGGGTVTLSLSGSKGVDTNCASTLCGAYCGLATLAMRYEDEKNVNPGEALLTKATMGIVSYYVMLYQQAQSCGISADLDGYLAKIKSQANFSSACSCDSDTPQLLVNTCGCSGGGTYTFAAGNGLTVTNVDGTVTYSMADTQYNKLQASYNTVVAVGAGLSLGTVTVGDTTTYTVTNTSTAPSAGSITASMLASDSVTTVKILDANVTTAKLADQAVTAAKIANTTITAAQIANATITATQIAAATITTTQIAANTIVAGNIANTTITGGKLVNATITTTQIAAGTILGSNIAASTITTGLIAAANITTALIAPANITTALIADGNITTAKYADGSITTAKYAAGSVDTTALAANAVATANIQNGAVSTAKYAAGSVDTAALGTNSVTTAKITAANVTIAKLETALLYFQRDIPVSFAATGVGTFRLYSDMKCTLTNMRATVTSTLGAGDAGSISVNYPAGAPIGGAIITIPLSTPVGTGAGSNFQSTPVATTIAANDYLELVTAKPTAGGTALVTLSFTRTA